MPIPNSILQISVRRAIGLGAAAVVAAIAIWIVANNSNKKKKKREITFPNIEEEAEEQNEQFVQQVQQEEKEKSGEEMEVLVSSTIEESSSKVSNKDVDEEVLIEVLEIDEEKPTSRSWTDLVEEELEADANQLEQSLASQLPKSQPQLVVSFISF